ncbi:MAG: hypothetical protein ACO2PN_11140 [Pyrobaculum sp.]|jgi:hypothetical protein
MSLYVVKTFKETPPLVTDITIRLKDGKAMAVPAHLVGVRKIYAQYELDVGEMDEGTVLSFKGKKTRFVEPNKKECNGTYRVGGLGLLAIVALDGKMTTCNIPKCAIIAIEKENGEEIQRRGMFRGIEGYEVEYLVCLPEGVTPQDVDSAR